MSTRLIAGLIAAVPIAASAEPLQPTSKWNVDYGVAQCTAARNYGTESEPLYVIMKPSPFGGVMRLLFARKGEFLSPASEQYASLRFDDQPAMKVKALKFSSPDRKLTVYSVNLPTEKFRVRHAAKAVGITTKGLDERFALDSIAPLLNELERCRTDLLQLYNADRLKIREIAQPVEPLSSLYSAEDYPSDALSRYGQGKVEFSLLVDETGKVQDCSVDTSAGDATLDTMSCYVIQERAKFRPAVSMDGMPVKSIYNQQILWEIR